MGIDQQNLRFVSSKKRIIYQKKFNKQFETCKLFKTFSLIFMYVFEKTISFHSPAVIKIGFLSANSFRIFESSQ